MLLLYMGEFMRMLLLRAYQLIVNSSPHHGQGKNEPYLSIRGTHSPNPLQFPSFFLIIHINIRSLLFFPSSLPSWTLIELAVDTVFQLFPKAPTPISNNTCILRILLDAAPAAMQRLWSELRYNHFRLAWLEYATGKSALSGGKS